MKVLSEPLRQYDIYREMEQDVEAHHYPISVTGCVDSQKSHLISTLSEKADCRLILTYREEKAREIYEDLNFFTKNAVLYPSKDILFYSADIHSNQVVKQRMEIMKMLSEKKPLTIVACFDVLMEKQIPFQAFESECITIDGNSIIEQSALKHKLIEMGYESMALVEKPGDYSIRGDVVDIFPLTEEAPIRICLWDNTIDSIKSFDVDSQRSIEDLDAVCIYPASDMILTGKRIAQGIKKMREEYLVQEELFLKKKKRKEKERLRKMVERITDELQSFGNVLESEALLAYFYEETESLLDYLPKDTIVFLDEPHRVFERGRVYEQEFMMSMENRLEGGYILPGQSDMLYSFDEVLEAIKKESLVLISSVITNQKNILPKREYHIQAKSIYSYNNSFEQLVKDLKNWSKNQYRIMLMSSSKTRAERLADDLRQYGLKANFVTDYNHEMIQSEIMVVQGRLNSGFEYPDIQFVVLTENDIFKERRQKRRKKKSAYKGQKIASLSDLVVGDYVVHEKYGLGIYQGIESIETDGVTKDYISIEYRDNSSYMFPVAQLQLIQKYANGDSGTKKPKINKLSGTEWEKTKSKVRSQVRIAAKELVNLYASRQATQGYQFGEDTVWQKEFEELFPYEETEDQLTAIEETKQDMESTKIMDRLLCGDVGYGKTEVALRAAFKAVMDSKQVVLLVPTTILAQQHYNSFCERMKHYPLEIRMMSRFCTPKETRQIQEGLKKGEVDIVIGTHKILSKNTVFKNLGLLIIDEEQRFGVKQKEKIKQLKKDVDVLALSATPIPRTLHMSLAGIRDMSILEEPPVDRRSVQTYVLEYNEEMVREAIQRELARDGQVYYVYNRVNNIEEIAANIKKLVPDANVEFAHGQMGERQLETIMMDFIQGKIDVLVSTTIIETGLDIPNANTMIIHDAQNFGLSQLYQLRGRVGRSSRAAYAFLMYQRNTILKEEAEKRLKAIKEFTDLGSGFKIAMRDLEIRGAGNLLGAEQSGHIASVGYDLYCKMLSEAVSEMKGDSEGKERVDTVVDIAVNAYIPANYVKNEGQKLGLYKKISRIENEEEKEDVLDEVIDRYGDVPAPLLRLLEVALLRAKAQNAQIALIEQKSNDIRIVMDSTANIRYEGLNELLNDYPKTLRIPTEKPPTFLFDVKDVPKKNLINIVSDIVDHIEKLKSIDS